MLQYYTVKCPTLDERWPKHIFRSGVTPHLYEPFLWGWVRLSPNSKTIWESGYNTIPNLFK